MRVAGVSPQHTSLKTKGREGALAGLFKVRIGSSHAQVADANGDGVISIDEFIQWHEQPCTRPSFCCTPLHLQQVRQT